jgi:hypothetical protein
MEFLQVLLAGFIPSRTIEVAVMDIDGGRAISSVRYVVVMKRSRRRRPVDGSVVAAS